mmetsp:Transcript_52018/g.137410  ORF Transcript_52018/g.137410 Transcript_52018/m.137410 type:complete len:258 (-) Transcript_52018:40-813(-)
MAPALPLAKLVGVFLKQVSKPLSSRLQVACRTRPVLRNRCVRVGQALNWASVLTTRMSMDRGSDVEAVRAAPYFAEKAAAGAEREALGMLPRGRHVRMVKEELAPVSDGEGGTKSVPMCLVEWTHGGKTLRGWAYKQAADGKDVLRSIEIKPISEDDATERGAVFIGEAFVFTIAGGIVLWEYRRSLESAQLKAERDEREAEVRAQEAARRDEQIQALQVQVTKLRQMCESLQAERARAQGRAATARAASVKGRAKN